MSVNEIIAALGGYREVSSAIGADKDTVYAWQRRGSIPASHWSALVALAARKGVTGVTMDTLAATALPPAIRSTKRASEAA